MDLLMCHVRMCGAHAAWYHLSGCRVWLGRTVAISAAIACPLAVRAYDEAVWGRNASKEIRFRVLPVRLRP